MNNLARLAEELPLNNLGEGAFWDPDSRCLWWVDTNEALIHRFDTASRSHFQLATGLPVSFVFPENDGAVIAGLADGLYRIAADSGKRTLIAPLELPHDHRLNDGKLDLAGRLWVGTINSSPEPSATAALYRVGENGFEEVEGGYTNANGKVWSPDGNTMYHADTSRGTIWQYDYDVDDGSIANKRAFVTVPDGHPDGLAIDGDGKVFAAVYGGSHVACFDPRGREAFRIKLPVPNPTSCAFGGDDLRQLFVTTAFQEMSDEQRREAPLSGSVFVIDVDKPGLPQSPRPSSKYLPNGELKTT